MELIKKGSSDYRTRTAESEPQSLVANVNTHPFNPQKCRADHFDLAHQKNLQGMAPMASERSGTYGRADRAPLWWEMCRIGGLALFSAWLFGPFFTTRLVGAGDALWYSNMLADFVTQWRAGVFPVFVGQTEYAFNGAIYPLRVAPLFQHWGGILDLLTGRQLSFVALQNGVIASAGIFGLFSAYVSLRALAPSQANIAALLGMLYVMCPGVLALAYTQDLLMSWVALPFLPLALAGSARTWQRDDALSMLMMCAGVSGLWLAHAPIALWTTSIVAISQIVRLALRGRNFAACKRATVGLTMIVALGSYPFVSLFSLRSNAVPPPTTSAVLDHPEKIVEHLRTVFPAVLKPVSESAMELSDLQLGYSSLATLLLALTIYAVFRPRSLALGLPLVAAVSILAILWPLGSWSELFWLEIAPEPVRRLTYYWPMHRLYVVLAALTVVAGTVAYMQMVSGNAKMQAIAQWLLALLVLWSALEARKFVGAAEARTANADRTALVHRSENVLLMSHAYGLYSKLPEYFSHGVMDPYAESRILDPKTAAPLSVPPGAQRGDVQQGQFVGRMDANPGILNLAPTLRLKPEKRYELEFQFRDRDYAGILQLVGSSFFREYVLPESGGPLAFGAGPQNSHRLSLWTTRPDGETIQLRFIPTAPGARITDYSDFGGYRFSERATEPGISLTRSLLPYRAEVYLLTPAPLETPRMYLPGYEAQVNGAPARITATPEALLAIDLPAGKSLVELNYRGPLILRLSYGLSLFSWCLGPPLLIAYCWKSRRSAEN